MKIKVWHGEKHDESTVTIVEAKDGIHRWVHEAKAAGGFYSGSHAKKNFIFVPWGRINWVEQVEDEDAAQEGEVASDSQPEHS